MIVTGQGSSNLAASRAIALLDTFDTCSMSHYRLPKCHPYGHRPILATTNGRCSLLLGPCDSVQLNLPLNHLSLDPGQYCPFYSSVCMCVCVRAHCVCIRCHSARAPGLSRLSARARTPDHLRVCASRRKSRFLGSFSGLKPPATMAGRRDVLHANQHAGHPGGAVSSGASQKRVHPPRPGPVFGARNRNRPVPKWTAEARATPQTSYH